MSNRWYLYKHKIDDDYMIACKDSHETHYHNQNPSLCDAIITCIQELPSSHTFTCVSNRLFTGKEAEYKRVPWKSLPDEWADYHDLHEWLKSGIADYGDWRLVKKWKKEATHK